MITDLLATMDRQGLAPGQSATRASYQDGSGINGGLGVIARRSIDPRMSERAAALFEGTNLSCNPAQALMQMAQEAPLQLLRILLPQSGPASMAQYVDLALGFGPGKIRFVARKEGADGTRVEDVGGTAQLNRLWTLYAGGNTPQSDAQSPLAITAILAHAALRLNDTGMFCFEAVPGKPGEGVTQILDFDPLTCRFRDDNDTGARLFEQQDNAFQAAGAKIPGAVDGWRPLIGPQIIRMPWWGSRNNPYGSPRYGAALGYLLAKVARNRQLRDWLSNAVWPKVVISQTVSALLKVVTDNPAMLQDPATIQAAGLDPDLIGQLRPDQWVALQFRALRDKLATAKSDDILFIAEGDVTDVNPSDISGASEVLRMTRMEEVQAMLTLPNLLGITDGGTQAYSEVQWLAVTEMLNFFRAFVAGGVAQLGTFHLRWLGSDLVCEPILEPIPPINRETVEKARAQFIQNEEKLARQGINSPDEYATAVSGSAPADPARLKDALAPAPDPGQVGGGESRGATSGAPSPGASHPPSGGAA